MFTHLTALLPSGYNKTRPLSLAGEQLFYAPVKAPDASRFGRGIGRVRELGFSLNIPLPLRG